MQVTHGVPRIPRIPAAFGCLVRHSRCAAPSPTHTHTQALFRALFSSLPKFFRDTVALSFVCGSYCSIIN
jgi:hypothetical protein